MTATFMLSKSSDNQASQQDVVSVSIKCNGNSICSVSQRCHSGTWEYSQDSEDESHPSCLSDTRCRGKFVLPCPFSMSQSSNVAVGEVDILVPVVCTILRVSSKIRLIYEGSNAPVGPEYLSVARQTPLCFAMRAMLTEFVIGIDTEYEDAAATMTVSLLFGPER